jgi:hypothetical protein
MSPELAKEIINCFLFSITKEIRGFYQIFWSTFLEMTINYWLLVIGFLILLLIIAILEFIITGRWWVLAKVLYRCSYFGILFIIVLAFGPEILTSNWIKILSLIIGIICFELVGYFLRQFKFK